MSGDRKSLSSLKQRIDEAEDARKVAKNRVSSRAHLPANAMALVGRIAVEMVAGICVGGFIGWLLDKWLGTTPLMMIILFFLGAGAGMMNIWRMANGHGLKVGYFDQNGSDATDGQNKKRTRR
jgi:ATP synthase protein I